MSPSRPVSPSQSGASSAGPRAPGFEPVQARTGFPRNPVFIGINADPNGSDRVRKRLAEPETAGSTERSHARPPYSRWCRLPAQDARSASCSVMLSLRPPHVHELPVDRDEAIGNEQHHMCADRFGYTRRCLVLTGGAPDHSRSVAASIRRRLLRRVVVWIGGVNGSTSTRGRSAGCCYRRPAGSLDRVSAYEQYSVRPRASVTHARELARVWKELESQLYES